MCFLIIKSKVWKDKGGGEEASKSRTKIWWWLKGSSFIGWWSIWKMEAKVVEVGGKIISSVYIDEKSKSPEKLSSICYMSQCWHAQFMKTMSIFPTNEKPCFIQTQFSRCWISFSPHQSKRKRARDFLIKLGVLPFCSSLSWKDLCSNSAMSDLLVTFVRFIAEKTTLIL